MHKNGNLNSSILSVVNKVTPGQLRHSPKEKTKIYADIVLLSCEAAAALLLKLFSMNGIHLKPRWVQEIC